MGCESNTIKRVLELGLISGTVLTIFSIVKVAWTIIRKSRKP